MLATKPADHPSVKDPRIGVLLLNLGTPDSPDYWPMRRYLSEFLSDRRVIETNPVTWQLILQGIILNVRPQRSGANYRKIWDNEAGDSPLRVITRRQTEKLQARLLGGWIELLGEIAGRGIGEGDIVDHADPEDIGRMLVSIYMGLRQASNLDDPVVLLGDYQKALLTVLRGIVQPDKIDYFAQFLRRRTALAVKAVSPPEI